MWYTNTETHLQTNTKTKIIMTIIATKDFQRITFTWNEDLTEYTYNAFGVSDEEMDAILNSKLPEGADFDGWEIEIL